MDAAKLEEWKRDATQVDRLALRCAGTQATEAERRAYHVSAGMLAAQVPTLIAEVERLQFERNFLECSNCHAPIASWGHHPKCGHASKEK